jgi:hypothetical protein
MDRFMGKKETAPNFDLTRSAQIGKYVAYYIDELLKNSDTDTEAMVLEKLKVVFTPDFKDYLKVVNGKRFTPSFFQKIGKRRMDTFKRLSCKIDEKYKDFDYR